MSRSIPASVPAKDSSEPSEQWFSITVTDESGTPVLIHRERGYSPRGVITQVAEKMSSGQFGTTP